MASTITDQQSGSLEQRREGVNVLTKEQQFNTSILRIRPNSSDLMVYLGRVVDDNFFDENLIDMDVAGSITSAPSSFAERRTLGQGLPSEIVFTDIGDFDPVTYITDEGLALYPTILTALGYADPAVEDGTVGVFETRAELVGFRFLPQYAKRGMKASLGDTSEGVDRKFYSITQEIDRDYSSTLSMSPKYFEIGSEDHINEFTTYQDQESTAIFPFIDSYDTGDASELSAIATMNMSSITEDPEMSRVIASGLAGSYYKKRDKKSASAGWTFLNVLNGTDSIVYSDRM